VTVVLYITATTTTLHQLNDLFPGQPG